MIWKLSDWLSPGGRRAAANAEVEWQPSPADIEEMEARKRRSIERLIAEGVPYIEHLPTIEPSSIVTLRSRDEVVRRTACLYAVMAAGRLKDAIEIRRSLQERGLWSALSPREVDFLEGSMADQDCRQMSWRIEAAVPLLWHVGWIEALPRPEAEIGAGTPIDFLQRLDTAAVMQSFTERSKAEVLDEADLIYRYHWATRDAQLKGRPPPAGLDYDVIMERHHALNWLINYNDGAEWDDVTTDT